MFKLLKACFFCCLNLLEQEMGECASKHCSQSETQFKEKKKLKIEATENFMRILQ